MIGNRSSLKHMIQSWRAASGCIPLKYFHLLLPFHVLDELYSVLQPVVFLDFFLYVPAPSLLRCGDVEENPGPRGGSHFDVSTAIKDLESYRRFTEKLRAHVNNLIHHAGYSSSDFEKLEYQTKSVKDNVFYLLQEN